MGESGRGFTVVADEVRALAQRTGTSLGDIQAIIEQLQSSTKKAVATMQEGVNKVSEGTEVANTAGDSITHIVDSIESIKNINTQIATEQQNVVAKEMNKMYMIFQVCLQLFIVALRRLQHKVVI
ncbi:MAG: hypothetical protein GY951_08440 [Psychromonas sp.]|nr:hypothetical protein [Psychromonas sp.]